MSDVIVPSHRVDLVIRALSTEANRLRREARSRGMAGPERARLRKHYRDLAWACEDQIAKLQDQRHA
jgi:hypothetical protein